MWDEQVEASTIEDELKTHQITLVQSGNEYFLAHSDRKTKYTQVVHSIIPQVDSSSNEEEAFPADSKDEQEKKDPDLFQNNIFNLLIK